MQLSAQLAGKPCRLYSSDLRVCVLTTGLTSYPDATVVCGELRRDPDEKNIILNPALIVEVTSDSTEDYDRGAKFVSYRQIPSLIEYVLVSHHEKWVEVLRRSGDQWSRV